MQRREVRFTGRVQGVGFRMTTRHLAEGHEVTGWVRNEPDGTVLAQIQGSPDQIDSLLGALDKHMGGLITDRAERAIPIEPGEVGFVIRFA